MFEKIKSYLNTGFNFYGVEIFDVDEKTCFQVSHIQKKKNELSVLSNYSCATFDELLESLDNKIPVCVSYNTKNVLDRIVEKREGRNLDSIIEHAFPNLAISRFYFNIASFENENYLAIVEKKTIDVLIQNFTKAKIRVASLCIGISSLVEVCLLYTSPNPRDS